jgi:hypothetical protein
MSALAQQQQQSPQVQQPSQQASQQGPAPEAASFGAGNAVDFQSAYVLLPDALHPRSGVKPRTGWGADARGGAVHAPASYPQDVQPRAA